MKMFEVVLIGFDGGTEWRFPNGCRHFHLRSLTRLAQLAIRKARRSLFRVDISRLKILSLPIFGRPGCQTGKPVKRFASLPGAEGQGNDNGFTAGASAGYALNP